MKRILFLILPGLIALSCDDDAKPDGDACGVKLTLVEMKSVWMAGDNSTPSPDTKPHYKESIVLSYDSTFVKTRTQDGMTTKEKGTYTHESLDNRKYVKLKYTASAATLRTSCISGDEWIEIVSPTQFKNTEWMACDGPLLVYEAKTVYCNE